MMWRKVLFLFLLLACLILPAFCGFGWVKNSSTGYSQDSLKAIEYTTQVATMSSNEEQKEEKPIETPSKSLNDLSVTYEAATADYGVLLEEAKASLKKEEQQKLVEDLTISKAVADEQFYILANQAKDYEKKLENADRKMNGVNFAVGASIGYTYPSKISPGIDMQMRAGNWIMTTGISYELDWAEGLKKQLTSVDPTKIETRIGVLYEF